MEWETIVVGSGVAAAALVRGLLGANPGHALLVLEGSKLIVEGTDLRPGAFIEIDGTLVRDTVAKKKRISSKAAWEALAPAGQEVRVTILNPDGGHSEPYAFVR